MRILFCFCLVTFFSWTKSFSQQWVMFCAQDGVANESNKHAYVTFFQLNPETKNVQESGSYGFNASADMSLVLFILSWTAEGELSDNSGYRKDHTFLVEVTGKEYNNCLAIIGTYRKKLYSLPFNDCVTMIKEVAQSLRNKIVMPTSLSLLPAACVEDLRSSNLSIDLASRIRINNLAVNKNASGTTSQKEVWNNFIYQNNLFQIACPQSWETIVDLKDSKLVVRQPLKSDGKLNDAAVAVYEIPAAGNEDLGVLKANMRKNIVSRSKPEIKSLITRNNGMYKGVYADYTYRIRKDVVHEISWFVYEGNRCYHINYFAKTEFERDNSITGNSIVNSFILKPRLIVLGEPTPGIKRVENSAQPSSENEPDTKKIFAVNPNLAGGATPEDLGRVLLKALKTNDKNLWNNCLHPEVDQSKTFNSTSFERIKGMMARNGITDWSLAVFSRATYATYNNGISGIDFNIEFLYNNKEFVGRIYIPAFKTYDKKCLISNPAVDYEVKRNNGR